MPSFRRHDAISSIAIVALVVVCVLVGQQQPTAQASVPLAATSTNFANLLYPHVMLYTGVNSNGWPLVGSTSPSGTCSNNPATACEFDSDCGGNACQNRTNTAPALGTAINQTVLQQYAGFSMVTLPPTPIVDLRTDLVPALRAVNPAIKIFAYVMPTTSWCPIGGYPSGVYYGDVRELAASFDSSNQPYRSSCLTNGDSFLHMQDGGLASDAPNNLTMNINFAKRILQPDDSYTYPVAEAMADLVFTKVYQSHLYDGIFHDVFSSHVLWMEHDAVKFDYQANGYGTDNNNPVNRTNFEAGWTAGFRAYGQRLRALIAAAGDPNFPITGNGGLSDTGLHQSFNGWMRENFPNQAGGTWYTNMYDPTVGYLIDNQAFRAPQINYLFGATDNWWTPYTAANTREARFVLGSASLGEGYGIYQESSVSILSTPMWTRWYDEYGVNVVTGDSAGSAYRGWLGQPVSDVYQMIATNPNPELVTNSSFETDTTGWQWGAFSPAAGTMARDTSGGAVGSAAVHLTITSTSTANWQANFSSSTTFNITQGLEYSATFWAKADHPRTIDVVLDKSGGGGYAFQALPLTTNWKQYQVRLVPNTSTTGVNIRFDMANETGEVWLDDIHLQLGVTSVFRRDFNQGIVLVNPSSNPQTVTLEQPYKKIHGTVDPTVNDGSIVSSVVLAGAASQNGTGDAIFLITIDETPPGQVLNLQAQ